MTTDQIRQAQLDMLKARLDADVAAGRLTQAQADQILEQAKQGGPMMFGRGPGGPGGPGFGRHGMHADHAAALAAVAKLMDVTPAQLRAQLTPGTSLAEAAAKKGVSRDKVVEAIKGTIKADQLPPGVTAQQLAERIADQECGPGGRGGPGFRHFRGGPDGPGFGRGFGPPPSGGGGGSGGSGTTTTPQYGTEG